MRAIFLILLLSLTGCLGTQPAHNPMVKKAESTAAVTSSVDEPKCSNSVALPPPAKLPQLDGVDLMKEMFLAQRDLNVQILKMAERLSETEMLELNLWLKQFGVEINRKAKRPRSNRAF